MKKSPYRPHAFTVYTEHAWRWYSKSNSWSVFLFDTITQVVASPIFYMFNTTVCNMWIIHSNLSFRFLQEPLTHMAFNCSLRRIWHLSGQGGNSHTQYFFYIGHEHIGQKAWARKRDFAKFVVQEQVKHVHAAKFIFAKTLAIGTTIGRDFGFPPIDGYRSIHTTYSLLLLHVVLSIL